MTWQAFKIAAEASVVTDTTIIRPGSRLGGRPSREHRPTRRGGDHQACTDHDALMAVSGQVSKN